MIQVPFQMSQERALLGEVLPHGLRQDLIMKLRKWTVFVLLAFALLTACSGDDNPGGNPGSDSGNTETSSGYN